MWIKKAGTTKPSQHKPGPGILPANGDTKVKICTDATGQSGCAPVGRGFWPRSMPNAGGANSVVVPIGYKAGLNLNVFDGIDEAADYGGSRVGTCGNLTADGGNKVWNRDNQPGACFVNGWNPGNRPDGIIVSQVPIDLTNQSTFNNLASMGVGPNDVKDMRNTFCADWNRIDTPQCIGWLNPQNPGSASYNTVKMGLCSSQPDWTTDPRCVNAINQVFKTGSDGEKNMANQMVILKCGTNPSSPACACYNATNRSVDDCLRTPELPGCKSISDKVGKYKTLGATFMTTALKSFCACDECTIAKTGSAGTVISQPAADQPGLCQDKINACFQNITVEKMSGGNLNAGCTIQDINPPPPPPPSGGGASPPPPPGGGAVASGPAKGAVTTSAAPNSKKGLAIGLGLGGLCLFLIFALIAIFFVMKKKGVKTA